MHARTAATFFLLMSLQLAAHAACAWQRSFDASGGELTVGDTSIHYAEEDGLRVVTSIATLRNTSNACVENIYIEVKYFDQDKKLVDVVTQTLGSLTLPAGQEASFRVRDRAVKPRSAYATSAIRVISVEQKVTLPPPAKPKEEPSLVASLIASWGPLLLFMVLWIMGMRRLLGKKSAAERQVVSLDRIAAALEAANSARGMPKSQP